MITCALFLNIMTQMSSHRGADPLVIGTAGSCVCCLMSNKKQKRWVVVGRAQGQKCFFGARMFFFNIPHLLDKFEIMLNHGIVDELVVFNLSTNIRKDTYFYIYIHASFLCLPWNPVFCSKKCISISHLQLTHKKCSETSPGMNKLPMTWTASQFLC